MLPKAQNGLLARTLWMPIGAFLAVVVLGPQVTPAATLGELKAQAKKEGAVNATVVSRMKGRTISNLAAAFKKRFGLNIDVTITPAGDTRHYPKAAAATRAGAVPTYDALWGSGLNNVQLISLGGVQKIDGWQTLLKEMHPLVRSGKARLDQISPEPFTGYAFHNLSRLFSMLYNTKLISKEELPKTHAELGNPKFKDRLEFKPLNVMKNYTSLTIKGLTFLLGLLLISTSLFSNSLENSKHASASTVNITVAPITSFAPLTGAAGQVVTVCVIKGFKKVTSTDNLSCS